MKRSGPIARHTPLSRGKALRRAAIVAAVHAAAARPRRRSKTTAGEFSPRVRRLLFARFGGRCAACGDPLPPKGWTAQHRRARGMGGSKDPAACSPPAGVAVHQVPCHERIEANPTQALIDGFRIPQYQHPRDWPIRIWTGQFVHLTDDGGYRPLAAPTEETP